ncbi:MAG: hypothetical protein HPY73_02925 [Methanomassiliicoccales archaeon]|nr:MAG: hypothetical protein HPY73_02925 [Methanomassiliicoccales archaeon]
MAQKKKKDSQKKEPEFTWTPPDFNEREFLEKDIKGTKALWVTALIAPLFGIMAFLTQPIHFAIGLLLIIVGMVSLKYIYPLAKIDTKEIDKKGWAGNLFLFFLLSMGVWIILLNKPFS